MKDQVFASPYFVTQFKVSTVDLKPWPYERFELKYTTPGTAVIDETFPEVEGDNGVTHEIPANPEQLAEAIEAARAKYQMRLNAERRSRLLRVLFMAFNGVCVVGLVVYLIVRWRK